MVFQSYSSYPWLTVLDNVAFGLKLRGVARDEREQTARAWIEKVGLNGRREEVSRASSRAACGSGWPSPAPSP